MIILDLVVNEIVFFISCSDNSLSVCRKTINICMLILYTAMLLNLIFSTNRFFVELLGFLYIRSHYLQADSFTSFLIWLPFISFHLPIALVETSSNMFNRSVDSEHPFLVPDLKGIIFKLSPLGVMLSVILLYMASFR